MQKCYNTVKRVVEGDQSRSKAIETSVVLAVIKGNHTALKTSNTYFIKNHTVEVKKKEKTR